MRFAASIERPIAFWNSSYVRWPSIGRRTTSPVRGTIAIGQSASPKLSSSLFRSRQTTPPIFPEAQEVTRSFIGTPASARATAAAVSPAHLVPASAWRTSMKMSTVVRGNCSLKTTAEKASEMTLEISTDRRSGPGRFRSVTLNGAMLYRHGTRARAGSWRCLGCASRGPYTAARTLFPPHSTYADPSARRRTPASIRIGRSSSWRRPSRRTPFSSISFSSFGMCSMSTIRILPSGGGSSVRVSVRGFQELPHGLREAERLGSLLDEPDRPRGDHGVAVRAIEPDPPVLADVDPTVREVRDEGDHASLLPDDARDFRRGDLEELPAAEAPGLRGVHRDGDPLNLVHAGDMAEDRVADVEEPGGVAELDVPRDLRRMEGRRVGRVDVHEPVRRADVDDLAADPVAARGDVPPGERNHAHEAVAFAQDTELARENPAAFAVRSGSRFQSGTAHGFARDDNRANRAFAFHRGLSLTRRRRNGDGYLRFWVRAGAPAASTPSGPPSGSGSRRSPSSSR